MTDDIDELLTEYAIKTRGSMKGRAISEFGYFLREMRRYLTFGDYSDGEKMREFQETVDPDQYKGSDWDSYIQLFKKYGNIEVE